MSRRYSEYNICSRCDTGNKAVWIFSPESKFLFYKKLCIECGYFVADILKKHGVKFRDQYKEIK